MITLRWKDKVSNRQSGRWISALSEGTLCLFIVAFCGFLAGVCFRFGGSSLIMLFVIIIAVLGTLAVQFRQVSYIYNFDLIVDCLLFTYMFILRHLQNLCNIVKLKERNLGAYKFHAWGSFFMKLPLLPLCISSVAVFLFYLFCLPLASWYWHIFWYFLQELKSWFNVGLSNSLN